MTVPLPPQWATILQDIQQRLDVALQACDARAEVALAQQPSSDAREREWDELTDRLRRLEALAQHTGERVHELDQVLGDSEVALREYAQAAAGLRSRLAGAGRRAIG